MKIVIINHIEFLSHELDRITRIKYNFIQKIRVIRSNSCNQFSQ